MAEKRQFDASSLADYIDVSERIATFKKAYPDGTLQRVSLDFTSFGGKQWVIYTAAAYRTPDDERPGIGTAWEQVPGTTPYTKDSEVMNAETAAWGRAIVALGLPSSTKIASRQEVESRRAEQQHAADLLAVKRGIAARLPGVEREEIVRRINEFAGVAEDFQGEHDLAVYQAFYATLGDATAEVDRAFGAEPK